MGIRSIEFRGKDIAGNWHYGVPLVFTEDYVCMTAPYTYNKKVEAFTVSQYTGLTDKNGTKIFEGDIVKTKFFGKENGKGCNFADFDFFKVTFKDSRFLFENTNREFGMSYVIGNENRFEVIGNIHDNPELLSSLGKPNN